MSGLVNIVALKMSENYAVYPKDRLLSISMSLSHTNGERADVNYSLGSEPHFQVSICT